MPAPEGNTNAQGNEGGRPSTYHPSYAKVAYKLCLAGFTDKQLADVFEVTERTINNWKQEYVEFFQSIKKGKSIADAEIAHSLYKRAKGFKKKATKFFSYEGSVITKDYLEYYPPDTTAAIFWLKNRQKEHWRDKVEVEATLKSGSVLKAWTAEELDQFDQWKAQQEGDGND